VQLVVPRIHAKIVRLARRLPAYVASGPDLVVAAQRGETGRIDELLDRGVPIDVRNAHGQSALHVAARCSRLESAAYLLARGASHRLEDDRGRRPLDPSNVDPEVLHGIRQLAATASCAFPASFRSTSSRP
jgi:ankyrin repeat protein